MPRESWGAIVWVVFLSIIGCTDCVRIRHSGRQAVRFHGGLGTNGGSLSTSEVGSVTGGLWPSVFNVATKASIHANATCGEHGREEFCRPVVDGRSHTGRGPGGHHRGSPGPGGGKCGVCDARSPDVARRHPVEFAIDGTSRWWQSPSMYEGSEYQEITITLDLKQVYQVVYVIVKSGNAPRPGAWSLERSVDGIRWNPWQTYARNQDECRRLFGLPATQGRPRYHADTQVICSTYYSKLTPLENGEIHTSLINGRPGANISSPELLEWTRARHVRLRLLRHGALPPAAVTHGTSLHGRGPGSEAKRLYYSIRDIAIGGQCVCSGHAHTCRHNVATGRPECECMHNTCGAHCEHCCPLYNQRAWSAGSTRDPKPCEPCQCHGHASRCRYDIQVEADSLSLDTRGHRRGGGVCEDCKNHTAGINCELCEPGYFRAVEDPTQACQPCGCSAHGSEGACSDGLCRCRSGYSGALCDRCSEGHRGYPNCVPCPCDVRGTVPFGDCEKGCICKGNVEGERCDRCKAGFFALNAAVEEGCLPCYCSEVSSVCENAIIVNQTYESKDNWQVTDLSVSQTITPTLDLESGWLFIGNYELPGVEAYYWKAPSAYLGNKLSAYGSPLEFNVHWVVMRGDTSGKPTVGPNVLLVGENGLSIAYGEETFTVTNATIIVELREKGWYVVPIVDEDVAEMQNRRYYRGKAVTREQFLSVLSGIKHMLLRGKFHTDQIEGALAKASLEITTKPLSETMVEQCSCPTGYTGLSCEICDYGYVKSSSGQEGVCAKCNCNGHSANCDANGLNCTCDHNTTGESCERCAVGFYGNPLRGTVEDCKRCACPLQEEENNFSPSCQLDLLKLEEVGEDYVCTQCPEGYTGDHCEICDYGFFGSPTTPGGQCIPCICGGSPCDRQTGQCLSCRGNTEGYRCERCKPLHFGDAVAANCQACECDPVGSLEAACDAVTGQCRCKERFTGRTCDRCQMGYGNVSASCPECSCNMMGSVSTICDPVNGLCACRPGVEGFHCDACQHLHYGFSEIGCLGCGCNEQGSDLPTCDIVTGQCRCKLYVTGRTCNTCQSGYWGLSSGRGCNKCACDEIGSLDNACDHITGQCRCKPGIGNVNCDSCKVGYFGFSDRGCAECETCTRPGHICDPDTGKCVCPLNTWGDFCEKCIPNSWGHVPNKGCKLCDCVSHGSTKKQCDLITGTCQCKTGYRGRHCDSCAFGYYGYPRCRPCGCHRAGVLPQTCQGGECGCSEDGQCQCKINVVGKQCNQCLDGTFGLHTDNPDGCTKCFCFGRTTHCNESKLTLEHIRLDTSRELTFHSNYIPHYSQQYSKEIISNNNLLEISNAFGSNLEIKMNNYFNEPLYWRLPDQFLGDRILSYGFYLTFNTETIGGEKSISEYNYPLVQIKGNDITIEYFEIKLPSVPHKNTQRIRFHESLWKRKDKPNEPVTKEILMSVLQNIQHILIKANNKLDFSKVVLHSATLDTAIELPGNPPPLARGIEKCDCPREYNASSCQNPSIGFYRWHNPYTVEGAIIIIGEARPCECNGRSSVCDIENGHCLNCQDNTSGPHCETCAEGYYGNPMQGKCNPCPCPDVNRNFAKKCHQVRGGFACTCKTGYTGAKCDRCKPGYFNKPGEDTGICYPCNCNKYGSISDECDQRTGLCTCLPGIIGKHCSKCERDGYVLENTGCKACDNCTQWLLHNLYEMSENLNRTFMEYVYYDRVQQFYNRLDEMQKESDLLNMTLLDFLDLQDKVRGMSLYPLNDMFKQIMEYKDILKKDDVTANVNALKLNSNRLMGQIEDSYNIITKTITDLTNYGISSNISTSKTLKDSRQIMKEIRRLSIPESELIQYCSSDLLDYIDETKNKYSTNTSDVTNRMKCINNCLEIALGYTNRVVENFDMAKNYKKINSDRYDIVEDKFNLINSFEYENEDEQFMVKEAKRMLNEADVNFKNISGSSELYRKLLKQIIKKLDNKPGNAVRDAQKHTLMLQKLADKYKRLFNITKDVTLALKASKAYENIIDTLNEAKALAKGAIDKNDELHRVLESEDIFKQFIEFSNSSDAIKKDAKKLKNKIHKLEKQKEDINDYINKSNETIWRTALKDNSLNSNLYSLTTNKMDMNEIIDKAETVSRKMGDSTIHAINVKRNLVNSLKPELNKLLRVDFNISLGEEQLTVFERNVINSSDILDGLERIYDFRAQNMKRLNNSIAEKIDQLKVLIQKAKHTAESLRLSLSSKSNTPCSQSYKLNNYGPTTSTNIGITLTLKNEIKNSSLFYLPTSSKDFMAVELIDRRIWFSWNLGADTQKISTPLPKFDENASNTYKIEVERIGSLATLKVYNKDEYKHPKVASGQSNSNFTVFDVNRNDLLWVGRTMPKHEISLNSTGLKGCLNSVVLDGKSIGLWNFVTTTNSCTGCANSIDVSKNDDTFCMNGQGYSVKYINQDPTSSRKIISFKFKTFDENSLLFLLKDNVKDRYASFSLSNGHLQFNIKYNNQKEVFRLTEEKYNNGKWVSVDFKRLFDKAKKLENIVFIVNTATLSFKPFKMDNNLFPNLEYSKIYIGGTPPGFKAVSMNISHASFLGHFQDIYVDNEAIIPTGIDSYGVESPCLSKDIRMAGFEGNGFIEMPPYSFINNSQISFIFHTLQENALLMAIIDEQMLHFSISIVSGKLQVKIFTGSKDMVLTSNSTVNDGHFHIVNVGRNNDQVYLRIDDVLHQSTVLSSNVIVDGPVYFGGFPEDYVRSNNIVNSYFVGTIKDYLLDNRLVPFNALTYFNQVMIGRSGSTPYFQSSQEMSPMMKSPEAPGAPAGCYRTLSYASEPGAVKFGDSPSSYVQHVFKSRNFWIKDFSFEFEFRTFYLNGLLFVSPGIKEKDKHKQHLLMTLKNHTIFLHIKGRKKKEILLRQDYNDGKWHRVTITNIKKRITLTVDDQRQMTRFPKKINIANMIYLGGIPVNGSHLPESVVNKLHPFRGCIRALRVNNQSQDLIRGIGSHNNVGQCFPQVEKGSYFAGDAYAIYKKNFVLNTQLEFQFEFRTSEQNGILLSMSEPNSKRALSLELYNGSVVMMENLGNKGPSRVNTNLSSEFTLCDNKWHKVSALCSKEEMTINVDSVVQTSLAIDSTFVANKIEGPLYIGGLPDYAPYGTLHSRENFKGCIRNIVIERTIVDWTDMDELHDILLNSCPVIDL